MTKRILSPAEFVREHRPEPGTYAERLAAFLDAARKALPYRFFDVAVCAKIALGLSKVPGPKSRDMDRFNSLKSSANTKLMKLYGCEIVSDRVDGLRASVDGEDLGETNHRKKRRRIKLAVANLKTTDNLIDIATVKNPELKRELLDSRKAIKLLDTAMTGLPQLPPKSTGN